MNLLFTTGANTLTGNGTPGPYYDLTLHNDAGCGAELNVDLGGADNVIGTCDYAGVTTYNDPNGFCF
jgi:hypothetical protein